MRDVEQFETPESYSSCCDSRMVWKKVYVECLRLGYTDIEATVKADFAVDSFEEKFNNG